MKFNIVLGGWSQSSRAFNYADFIYDLDEDSKIKLLFFIFSFYVGLQILTSSRTLLALVCSDALNALGKNFLTNLFFALRKRSVSFLKALTNGLGLVV